MPRQLRYLLGLDESGTGAWAGPATVASCVCLQEHADGLWALGVADSKALAVQRRLETAWALAACPWAWGSVQVLTPEALSQDHGTAKRLGFFKAAAHVLERLDPNEVEVIIDGSSDGRLRERFERTWGISPIFRPKADATVSPVAAASILAKTHRSALMQALAKRHPEYSWERNDGYGTADHQSAIAAFGITPHHRRIKCLKEFFDGKAL